MNIWQSRRRNTGSTKEHLCSPLVFGRVRVAYLISFLCCVFGRVRVAYLISFLCCVFGRVCVAYLISFLCCVFGRVCVAHLISFLCCVIEGDGPKNQTQSKMDMYETTVNAVLVN